MKYEDFMRSEQWLLMKKAIIRKRGRKCERCGAWSNLQLHHKNYDHEPGKERAEDLILVCKDCHGSLHADISDFGIIPISCGTQN